MEVKVRPSVRIDAAKIERERIIEVVSDKYMVIAYWFQTMPPSVAMGQLANLIDPAKFDDFSTTWQQYQDAIKGENKQNGTEFDYFETPFEGENK